MNKTTVNHQIDVCYVISHGFAARMLLQTGLIKQLALRGKRIAIVTPDAKDENLISLNQNENIVIYESPIQATIWDEDYNFKRIYYTEDVKANPVFWEKHIYSIFYSSSKHPWRRVRPFYYYLMYLLIKRFPSIRERFNNTEQKYLLSKKTTALIRQINPSLLVATYPVNFLEAKMLAAAKAEKIPTMIHLLSWDNITSKGRFPVVADHFIVWGEVMYQELKDYYGLADEFIHKCGVPHFDQHWQVKQSPKSAVVLEGLGLSPEQPYLFVAMSSPRFAPGEIEIVEWLAEAINKEELGEGLQLIVRPHPQNVQGNMSDLTWIGRLDKLKSERVAIDYPQLVKSKVRWSMKQKDMNHLSNLLAGCSVCLNTGSTVSIDALVMEKPVILTSFDGAKNKSYWKSARRLVDYPHQKKFIDLGGAKVVLSYNDLKKAIKMYIADPEIDMEKRSHALQMECYKNDGKATERVLEAVEKVLEQGGRNI